MLDLKITSNFAITTKNIVGLGVDGNDKVKIVLQGVGVVFITLNKDFVKEKALKVKEKNLDLLQYIKQRIEINMLYVLVESYTLIYFSDGN